MPPIAFFSEHILTRVHQQRVTESFQTALRARAERIGLESEVVNEANTNVKYLEAVRSSINDLTNGRTPSIQAQTVARSGGLGQDLYRELFAAAYDGKYPNLD